MELLVIFFFIYAVHSAVEDTKSALRKSRTAYTASAGLRFPKAGRSRRVVHAARHDAGFWLGQAAQGFPAARHGLAAGWHAGRQAQAEGRAARESAKADHLETRVRLIPEVRAHVARQRAALEHLRAEREAQEGTREGRPQSVTAPPRRAAAVSDVPAAAGQGEVAICPGEGRESAGAGSLPAPAVTDGARDTRAPGASGASPRRRVCVACGNPEYGPRRGGGNWGPLVTYRDTRFPDDPPEARLVHKAHFEDESTGFYGRRYEDAPAQDGPSGQPQEETAGSGEGTAAPETEPPASPTQGEPAMAVAADTSYDIQLSALTRIRDEADEELSRVKARRMLNHLDTLTSLGLDGQTLSDAAAVDDALKKQEDAAREALDAADTALGGLVRRHGGIQEAVDDSPVEVPAEPAFYAR